jgi:hypothetical protein
MTKCRLTCVLAILSLVAFAGTAVAAPPSASNRHCVVKVQPLGSIESQQKSIPECFSTFRDAIYSATKGIVRLPQGESFREQLDTLEREQRDRTQQLADAATYVIAIDYENINYGGSTLVWQQSSPCTPSIGYAAASMPSGWNDKLSSTRGYSDCTKNVLWEHQNFAGTKRTCLPNCSSVGTFNDKTSSREWHHTCEGVAGQWQGCRGTGCSVCSELVASYPCYFQNHPNCASNDICGGLYFTCSDACPAPTQADTCEPPPSCSAVASCSGAGGGTAFCSGTSDCFSVDGCYAYCDGIYNYCPSPPGICPL